MKHSKKVEQGTTDDHNILLYQTSVGRKGGVFENTWKGQLYLFLNPNITRTDLQKKKKTEKGKLKKKKEKREIYEEKV